MQPDKKPIGYQLVFQATEAKTVEEAKEQAQEVLGNTSIAELLATAWYAPGTTVQKLTPGSKGKKWTWVEVPTGFRVYTARGLN